MTKIMSRRPAKSGPQRRKRAASVSALAVPSRVRIEQKFITNPLTVAFPSVSTTGGPSYVDLCALIGAGFEYYNRVGRQVTMQRLSLRGTLVGGQINAVTDDPYNAFRIMVITGNVGISVPIAALIVSSVLSPELVPGLKSVLYDKAFPLQSPGKDGTGYLRAVKEVTIDLRLPSIVANFSGSAAGTQTGTTAYLIMASDSSTVPNPGLVDGTWVLAFSDV